MKAKALLLVPTMLLALASCSSSTPSSVPASDKFVAKLSSQNVGTYVTYSSSYTEDKTTDNKVKFTVTAIFTNIDDDYYYKNFKVQFRGVKTEYTIPKSGTTTITYTKQSTNNPSESVLSIERASLGKYSVISGEVYLKAK